MVGQLEALLASRTVVSWDGKRRQPISLFGASPFERQLGKSSVKTFYIFWYHLRILAQSMKEEQECSRVVFTGGTLG